MFLNIDSTLIMPMGHVFLLFFCDCRRRQHIRNCNSFRDMESARQPSFFTIGPLTCDVGLLRYTLYP